MEVYIIYNLKYKSTVSNTQTFTNEEKSIIANFKKNPNYKDIISLNQTLCGDEVYEFFHNKIYVPRVTGISNTIIYYSEFTTGTVEFSMIFFEFISSELITPSLLREDTVIATSIDRHIKAINNITNQDKQIFDYKIEQIMNEISESKFYDLTFHPLETMLNKTLYNYQKANINWMINLENNLNNYVITKRHLDFPDGRIYEYENNTFISSNKVQSKSKINGGLILDETGIGKTLQFICLAISNPLISTLILVPNHLYDHWISQFQLHLNNKDSSSLDMAIQEQDNPEQASSKLANPKLINPVPSWITIIRFSDYLNYNGLYQRIIVDEIHELYSKPENNKVFKKACLTPPNTLYKWGLTATPFPVEFSISNLIQFLSSETISNNSIEKFESNISIYKNFMRRNILANITDQVVLPELEIINNIISFTSKEQIIYDAEFMANTNADINVLRKLCCDTILAVEHDSIQFPNVNLMIKNYFEKQFLESKNKLDELETRFENAKKVNQIIKSLELEANILHYKKEIETQEVVVKARERSLTFLLEQFKELPMCPICMDDIDINTNCSVINVPGCNHIFCNGCIDYICATKSDCKCPNCRANFNKSNLIKISSNNVIQKYPSKISKLIEIINSIDKQIIIFSQFTKLIEKIHMILNSEQISTCVYNSSIDIDNFRQKNFKVLILSSTNNASGLDLSFVNNIIIFEPIIGTYSYLRDIEKQIIGRIYRINQQQHTRVHRLIMTNTIEEQIYNELS